MSKPEIPLGNGNGGAVFVPITNKDVWVKLVELEKKVDSLSIKIYAFATVIVILGGVFGVTGGVTIG
jgi:hypothetical protein